MEPVTHAAKAIPIVTHAAEPPSLTIRPHWETKGGSRAARWRKAHLSVRPAHRRTPDLQLVDFVLRVYSEELDEHREIPVDAAVLKTLRPDLGVTLTDWRSRYPTGVIVDIAVLGGKIVSPA